MVPLGPSPGGSARLAGLRALGLHGLGTAESLRVSLRPVTHTLAPLPPAPPEQATSLL